MAIEQLPAGCGYQGREFGAQYLDSECFGGRLYDMDNCDNDGNIFEPAEYIPCPNCNHAEALKGWLEEAEEDGFTAHVQGKPRKFPITASQLKHASDHKVLKAAWLKGWDESQVSAEKVSLVSARHPA